MPDFVNTKVGGEQLFRYIDIIFVKYGQEGKSDEFGLVNGICLSHNPSCNNLCELTDCCIYHKERALRIN